MRRFIKNDIPFMRFRKVFYTISIILVVISIASFGFRGLNLSVEFEGGTSIDFTNVEDVTVEQMRTAFNEAGANDLIVQTTQAGGEAGLLVRTGETSPDTAAAMAAQVAEQLGLPEDSYQVTTIGPEWGANVLKKSLIALIVSIICIIIYISIRFEFKMSLIAILALAHDMVIILGIYSLLGREISPNVIAALLTILGYSLYDTVVVFHRINENASPAMKHSVMWMANHSVNEVFIRTINTSITSLLPVLMMLFFGGATLKDFAFALTLGLIFGSYSSWGVAVPLFATWKGREPEYKKLAKKYGDA